MITTPKNRPMASRESQRKTKKKSAIVNPAVTKIFVLDTSVLLHDHSALHRFQEHRVALPLTVLEELDAFKVGNEAKHFEARQTARTLDALSQSHDFQHWIPIEPEGRGALRVILPGIGGPAEEKFGKHTNDHKILDAAWSLQQEEPEAQVILVTKDINLRLKARALGLPAEDYETGKVRDLDAIYTGTTRLEGIDGAFIRKLYQEGTSRRLSVLGENRENNHFYILKNCTSSALGYFSEERKTIERVDKAYAYGIKARNAEQAFALHAILNPQIALVTLCGAAGTGKTLLALAGALEQRNRYENILLARPVVALSNKDLGYLPGDAHDKVAPYMQPLMDNLNFIKGQFSETERKRKAIEEMQAQGRITISPLAYIRGRSIVNTVFIVDEAQNLTPHEVKTIITRAGENTKIILTGDLKQIDTPYLDERSNGLAYVIDRLRGQDLYAHVTLRTGERSALANLANGHL
jgi:PhoH-like ATPase